MKQIEIFHTYPVVFKYPEVLFLEFLEKLEAQAAIRGIVFSGRLENEMASQKSLHWYFYFFLAKGNKRITHEFKFEQEYHQLCLEVAEKLISKIISELNILVIPLLTYPEEKNIIKI